MIVINLWDLSPTLQTANNVATNEAILLKLLVSNANKKNLIFMTEPQYSCVYYHTTYQNFAQFVNTNQNIIQDYYSYTNIRHYIFQKG